MLANSKVVIVLVNYNSYADTEECIRSIKNYEDLKPFIVLIDNNSDDAHLLDRLKKIYAQIHIIKNSSNKGFSKANNIGIKWIFNNLDFQYILLLNNDTLITKNAITKLILPIQNNPKIGVTTSKIMYEHNRDIVWYGGGEINHKRGWPRIYDFNHLASENGANTSRFVSFVSGCVMMFSKECLQSVKGFDEDFFMYCEDMELCMRIQKKGYKLWYESESIIYHKVQGSLKNDDSVGLRASNTNLPFLFYHMKSNQWLTMKKHLNNRQFILFNVYFWLEFIYLNLKFLIKGRKDILKISTSTVLRIFKV